MIRAADFFMADPKTTAFLFGHSSCIDLADVIKAYVRTTATVANKDATEHPKRVAVRNAILPAPPERRDDHLGPHGLDRPDALRDFVQNLSGPASSRAADGIRAGHGRVHPQRSRGDAAGGGGSREGRVLRWF
ncbi:hypothetical protein ACLBWX_14500 [Methylobacterium sp. M6A4_1b]